jgi:hypothetical protein
MKEPLRAAVFSVAIQTVALATAVATCQTPFALLAIYSATAALLAFFLRLPLPWIAFNAVLPSSALWALTSEDELIPWLLGGCCITLLLLYLPTFWTRIPLYLSEKEVVNVLSQEIARDVCVCELGAGFGSVLFPLAKKRPDLRFIAYEVSPLPCLVLWLRAFGRNAITIRWRSFFSESFNNADIFFAFLSPEPMEEVWSKIEREATPGSKLYTYRFPVHSLLKDSKYWEVLPKKFLYMHEL